MVPTSKSIQMMAKKMVDLGYGCLGILECVAGADIYYNCLPGGVIIIARLKRFSRPIRRSGLRHGTARIPFTVEEVLQACRPRNE